jgi:ketosteroid isomerase-like protein
MRVRFLEGRMKAFLVALATTLFIGVAVFPNIHPRATVLAKDNAETLRRLEAEFMKSAAEHGSEGYMAYYAEDAVEVPEGEALLQGKESIAKTMGFLDNKKNQLAWTPVGADMSASGDLGYTYGNFEVRSIGKDGKPVVSHGKYTSIWKKQKDGGWKVVLDMGNSGPEPKS